MRKLSYLLIVSYLFYICASCTSGNKSTRIFGQVVDQQQHAVPGVELIINGIEKGFFPQAEIIAIPKTNSQGRYDTTLQISNKYNRVELFFQTPTDSLRKGFYRHYECRCNDQLSGHVSSGNLTYPTILVGKTSECNYTLTP